MRRTIAVVAAAVISFAAAAWAIVFSPRRGVVTGAMVAAAAPFAAAPVPAQAGALHVTTQLEHGYLSETAGGEVYLQVNLAADGASETALRVPVNAVMILDRSGSMSGIKIERAKDAARALIEVLGPADRFAVIDFASDARVLVASTDATPEAKQRALALVSRLRATTGTNLSAAFDAAAPQLREGRGQRRIDKVFVASDGQANEGVFARPALLRRAQADFGPATVSTFGIGEDYDELFMTQLAVQAGGRARYVTGAEGLAAGFAAELARATRAVAHDVRLDVRGLGAVRVQRVLGFESAGGSVRLPDVAAGEQRSILIKLSVPPGRGTAELAAVELSWRDERGSAQKVSAAAQATYTADAARLDAQKPNQISWQGAMAEMADATANALRYQAEGKDAQAKEEEDRVQHVAAMAAPSASPKAKRILQDKAERYMHQISASGAGDQFARKAASAASADDASIPAEF
jgi:Ca-activated chloride channel family protein